MSSFQVARLVLGPAFVWHEQLGDPVTNLGGAPIPAPRTALRHEVEIGTLAQDGATDTVAARLTLRRQLRSLMGNTPMKLQSFLYVVYSDDAEQNGWYVPDQGMLADYDASSGLATGLWKFTGAAWLKAGHPRVNREARNIWMRDLRTGQAWRDTLKAIFSTDFSALPALQLSIFPNGASQLANTVSGQVVPPVALPTGRDGGISQLVTGLVDLACVSYERAESALNLSDVIVYDRRGQITAPTTGPDTSWEEVYGPDYPWNWNTGGANDVPVLDNGLCRVRYDATVGIPGFRVDVWNGAAYVEQGKVGVNRQGDVPGDCDTWVAASLVEYTPDRATVFCVLRKSADTSSRERVYITMERGQIGATFECYPALKAAGTQADVLFTWSPALNAGVADLNVSLFKIDSQGSGSWTPGPAGAAVNSATAGTGGGTGNSGQLGADAALGNDNFTTSENWAALLRCPTAFATISAYQATFAVLQAANSRLRRLGSDSRAYGVADNLPYIGCQNAAGYLQMQVAFSPTVADQILEAEAMTLGTGTTTTTDNPGSPNNASGTGANSTVATRTTDANAHVTRATWPNTFQATYRVFARVRVAAGTGSFYAKTGATTGATVTTTSTTYVWLDLGEIAANNTTLEIHAWNSGANNTFVDRIEAVLVQDRTRTSAIYSGARDAGQAALYDSRTLGALVAR